jgi:FecR protein
MKAATLLIPLSILAACGKETAVTDGVITFVKGHAVIEHVDADGSKKTKPAKPGEKVFVRDTIVTSADSNIVFNVSGAQMEIQPNSRFLYERGGEEKIMYLQNGNAWTSVTKMGERGNFSLRTPTTVAGVRGTKFFTTVLPGGLTGTCHCEGKISYKNTVSGKEEINDGDYLVFYRGPKAVKVTLEDLKKLGIPANHNHSELDNGSMGKKNNMTQAQAEKMMVLVEQRFASQK